MKMNSRKQTVSTTATVPLVPHQKPVATTPEDLAAKKAAIEKQLAAIGEAEAAFEEQEKAAKAADLAKRRQEYDDLIADAEHNEKLSMQSSSEYDKKTYAKFALDLRKEAAKIYPEAATQIETQTDISEGVGIVNYWGVAAQGAALVFLLVLSWAGFAYIRDEIIRYNAALTVENAGQAMPAYGWDSFQKLFFEGFSTVLDIAFFLGMLFIVDKSSFKYIIPYVTGLHDADTEFNELTAWQRQLKTTLQVGFLFLFLALRHLVKA